MNDNLGQQLGNDLTCLVGGWLDADGKNSLNEAIRVVRESMRRSDERKKIITEACHSLIKEKTGSQPFSETFDATLHADRDYADALNKQAQELTAQASARIISSYFNLSALALSQSHYSLQAVDQAFAAAIRGFQSQDSLDETVRETRILLLASRKALQIHDCSQWKKTSALLLSRLQLFGSLITPQDDDSDMNSGFRLKLAYFAGEAKALSAAAHQAGCL